MKCLQTGTESCVSMWMIWNIAFSSCRHSNTKWYSHDIGCVRFRYHHILCIVQPFQGLCVHTKILAEWPEHSDRRMHTHWTYKKYVALTGLHETIEPHRTCFPNRTLQWPLPTNVNLSTYPQRLGAYTLYCTLENSNQTFKPIYCQYMHQIVSLNLNEEDVPDWFVDKRIGHEPLVTFTTMAVTNFERKRLNRHRNYWHSCTLFTNH